MATEHRCERVGTGVWPTRHSDRMRSLRRVRGHRALVSHVSARQTGGYQTARSRLLTVPWSPRTSAVAERQEVSAWIARRRRIAPNRRHGGARCSIGPASPTGQAPRISVSHRSTIRGGPPTQLTIRLSVPAPATSGAPPTVAGLDVRPTRAAGTVATGAAAAIASLTRRAPFIKIAQIHRPGACPDRASVVPRPASMVRR